MAIYMWEQKELCFAANTAGSTIQLTKVGSPINVTLETSTDGTNWSTYTFGDTITLSNVGDKVYWRNTSTSTTSFSTSGSNYYNFVMTGSINCSGDINYLLNKNSTTSISNYCFCYLFLRCSALTTAPELTATTLGTYCYQGMFHSCSSLKIAPKLPATTLKNYCYNDMFARCSSLINSPTLSATTLTEGCYAGMFARCYSLAELPKLSATSLQMYCYREMFYSCSNIKLSTTQTGSYQTAYRIPTTGTGSVGQSSLSNMFTSTGGTFTGTPTINTTYYTTNTLV